MTPEYLQHINSDKWKALRAKIIAHRKSCFVCGRENVLFNIHHKTYKRLGNEYERDLVLLCRECHEFTHSKLKDLKNNGFNSFYGYARRLRRRYKKIFQKKQDYHKSMNYLSWLMDNQLKNRIDYRNGTHNKDLKHKSSV